MASSEDQDKSELHLPTAAGATALLWFILLAFGGGCLAWYYSSIGYLPDIAWEEALSFLGVLSIIGGSLTVTFALLAFLPGVIWSEALLEDCRLRHPLRYRSYEGDEEPCILSIWRIIGKPFAIFIVSVHLLVAIPGNVRTLPENASAVIMVLGTLLSLVLTTRYFIKKVGSIARACNATVRQAKQDDLEQDSANPDPAKERASAMTKSTDQSRTAKYSAAFVAAALIGLAALLILERRLGLDNHGLRALILALFCSAVVAGANIFVASLFGKRLLVAIGVAGLATVLLLVVGEWVEGPNSLLHKVMRSYGFGESTHYDLIVTQDGGEFLKAQGLSVETGANCAWAKVRDIAILSRLGDNFFLRSGRRSLSLPRSKVLSWSDADAVPRGPIAACNPRLSPPAAPLPPPAPKS